MNISKKRLFIGGMTCVNCQNKIESALNNTAGIEVAKVSYQKGVADLVYDPDWITLEEIQRVIQDAGYEVLEEKTGEKGNVGRTISFLAVIFILYLLLQHSGILNLLVPSQLADTKMGYGMLFVIGLLTSVHCVAMCGGINLSQCIGQGQAETDDRFAVIRPAVFYNLGRVLSYTVIGGILGLVGMIIGGTSGGSVSVFFQGILKMLAGIFMILMGINMLGIFPGLRRYTPQIPKSLAQKIRRKKAGSRKPLVVGMLNGLMPCGPLQSMQIVALASGNPFAGSLSMFMFSIGTVPLMLGLGSFVSLLGKRFTRRVMETGAVLVVVLGLAMLSQGGSLAGVSDGTLWKPAEKQVVMEETDASAETVPAEETDIQIIHSTLSSGRYPDIMVQAGIPVKWIIDVPSGALNGCNYQMILRAYGISYTFSEGENVIEFTPEQTGTISYTCWMGMIRGKILVTDGAGESESLPSEETETEETGMGCCGGGY